MAKYLDYAGLQRYNDIVNRKIESILPEATASGNPISIDNASGFNAKSAKVTMLPIQSGSGDPSPTNIRPISGRDSVGLTRMGKNLFDEIYTDIGTIVQYKQIKVGNGTFTFSTDCPKNSDNASNLFALSGYATSGGSTAGNGIWEGQTRTVTTNDGYVTIAYRQTIGNNPSNYHTQIELGSSATAYEPYQGETHTAIFPSTVYGGEYEFVEGGLMDNYNIVSYDGTENWTEHSSGRFYFASRPSDLSTEDTTKFVSNQRTYRDATNTYAPYYSYGSAGIYCNKLSANQTLAEFKADLAVTPLQVCYPKTTPTTTTLTPQSISLNKGDNVITTDGDNAEVKYSVSLDSLLPA